MTPMKRFGAALIDPSFVYSHPPITFDLAY